LVVQKNKTPLVSSTLGWCCCGDYILSTDNTTIVELAITGNTFAAIDAQVIFELLVKKIQEDQDQLRHCHCFVPVGSTEVHHLLVAQSHMLHSNKPWFL
jgi:hypothetical protein